MEQGGDGFEHSPIRQILHRTAKNASRHSYIDTQKNPSETTSMLDLATPHPHPHPHPGVSLPFKPRGLSTPPLAYVVSHPKHYSSKSELHYPGVEDTVYPYMVSLIRCISNGSSYYLQT